MLVKGDNKGDGRRSLDARRLIAPHSCGEVCPWVCASSSPSLCHLRRPCVCVAISRLRPLRHQTIVRKRRTKRPISTKRRIKGSTIRIGGGKVGVDHQLSRIVGENLKQRCCRNDDVSLPENCVVLRF